VAAVHVCSVVQGSMPCVIMALHVLCQTRHDCVHVKTESPSAATCTHTAAYLLCVISCMMCSWNCRASSNRSSLTASSRCSWNITVGSS
jgi:hypothetical protein